MSDDQGRCRLAVRVGTEPGDWVVRATALRQPDVYAEQHLIVGLGDRRRITLEAPGLPSRSWNGSLPHPWRDEIILAQSEPDGGDLTLMVHDQYDNPVADLGVTLSVRALGAAAKRRRRTWHGRRTRYGRGRRAPGCGRRRRHHLGRFGCARWWRATQGGWTAVGLLGATAASLRLVSGSATASVQGVTDSEGA